jgi:hypothetical protein
VGSKPLFVTMFLFLFAIVIKLDLESIGELVIILTRNPGFYKSIKLTLIIGIGK